MATEKITVDQIETVEQLAAVLNKMETNAKEAISKAATAGAVKQVQADLIVELKEISDKIEATKGENEALKKKLDEMTESMKAQGLVITNLKTAFEPSGKKSTFSAEVKKALEGGAFNSIADKKASNASFQIETKDIAFGGFYGGASYQAGAAVQPVMPFAAPVVTPEEDFDVRTVVPTGNTSSSILEFPVERSWTDNMGALAENADSVESEVTFTMTSVQAIRLSTHITVSRTALKNVSWLSNHISTRLMAKFVKYLNTQTLIGAGTTVYLKGLLQYATTFTAGGLAGTMPYANWVDVLLAARARNYEVNKIKPNVVFVNPLDAVQITSIKSTIGEWANKEPFMTVSPSGVVSVMGMQIIESFDITAGTYLMVQVSPQNMQLLFNGPIEILATDSEASNFLKNLVTIKLEAECMLPVYHEGAIIKGTFVDDLAAIKGGI